MRRLHVVGKHEKFVASGVYKVYAGDQPTGLIEYWSIHEVGDGAQFVRVDVDGRDFDGNSTLLEALLNPDGHFERVDAHSYDTGASHPAKVSFTFFADRVEILQTVENDVREMAVDLPLGYHPVIDSRLLTGLAIANPDLHDVTTSYFLPVLKKPVLTWTIVDIELQALGDREIQVAGRDIAVSGYGWDSDMTVWIDRDGVAVQIETLSENALLTQYGRRPEPKPHA